MWLSLIQILPRVALRVNWVWEPWFKGNVFIPKKCERMTGGQRTATHNGLKDRLLPCTRQDRRPSERMAEVLICFTGSPLHMGSISSNSGKIRLVGGKIHGADNASLLVFAGSPTVFILNAVVLEIPTREQSEERASYGAEPRQTGGQRSDNISDREWWKTNSWLSSNKMTHTKKPYAGHMI